MRPGHGSGAIGFAGCTAGAVLALAAGCTGGDQTGPAGAGATTPSRPGAPAPAAGATTAATTAPCRPTPGGTEGPAAVAPAGTPSRVRFGPGRDVDRTADTVAISRDGEPLVVTGVVYSEDCRTPLVGATVEAYQTDAAGRYGPGEDCCYLQGVARTDTSGRYTFISIVPGRYPQGNPPPRHIHIALSHPQARSLTTELLFAGDPGVTQGDPLSVTPTERGGTQHVVFDIVLGGR